MAKFKSQVERALSQDTSSKEDPTYFFISVYILEDRQGEWWEFLNTDGNTNRFKPGTAEFTKTKRFKTADLAKNHGDNLKLGWYKVIQSDPCGTPTIGRKQTTVYNIDNRELSQSENKKLISEAIFQKAKQLTEELHDND